MIAAKLTAWSEALGMDYSTLATKMTEAGDEPRSREDITARRIFIALMGDEVQQKIRNLTLDADRKEREEKEAHKQLMPTGDLDRLIARALTIPLNNALESGAVTIDVSCNPDNPTLARKVIQEWHENVIKPMLEVSIEQMIQDS